MDQWDRLPNTQGRQYNSFPQAMLEKSPGMQAWSEGRRANLAYRPYDQITKEEIEKLSPQRRANFQADFDFRRKIDLLRMREQLAELSGKEPNYALLRELARLEMMREANTMRRSKPPIHKTTGTYEDWKDHVEWDKRLKQQYEEKYGGWNRKSRDAKGYASAADAAMRLGYGPGTMKTLAGGYQLGNVLDPRLWGLRNPVDEYKDYKSNAAGIDSWERVKNRKDLTERQKQQLIEYEAMRYADPFGDTTK